ncbi:MAG: hypothetical protein GXP29_11390, partial [Planctomycetes bacterium]|nr:hypothetical protein [Planctomycetota bacterium]
MIPERLPITRIFCGRCAGCVLSIALVLLGGGAVVCAGSPRAKSDPAAEAAFLRAAGEGFELRATAHFLIAHEGDPEALRDFIAR